jgi:PAS domain S-box-containing protein
METARGQDPSIVFQTILGYFPGGVSLIDRDLNVIAWNKEFKRLLRFPDELFESHAPTMETLIRFNAERGDYGPGNVEQQVEAGLARYRLMQPHQFERTRADGTVLEVRGTPLPDGSFITLYADITQRKQKEAQYLATLESAFEHASMGILFTRDRKVQHCNSRLAEIFAWNSPEDLIGQPGSVFWISDEAYMDIGKEAGPILSAGNTFAVECQFRRKDGSIFLGRMSARAINPAKTWDGTVWIAEDVTEKRAAERAIKESERRLSQIVDGSSIPTFVIDAEHRVTHWNQACANLTGLDAGEMIGRADVWRAFYAEPRPTMADLVLSETAGADAEDDAVARYYGNFTHSALIAGAIEAEGLLQHEGKEGRWLYFTAAPLRDSEGKLTGAIETLQDVTDRRNAEKSLESRTEALQKAYSELAVVLENLENAQDELVRSEKLAALGSMVAGVAHELNTPIGNALMVATHIADTTQKMAAALKSGLKRSALDEYLASADSSSDVLVRNLTKAAELVASFKQVAVDQTSAQRRHFDLAEMVAEIVTTIGPTIRKTPYVVKTSIPEGIVLDSYPGPLGQVLTNLINNAILHGFDGRASGQISIEAEAPGGAGDAERVVLKITDNGKGISPDVLPRIFDPFFTTRLGQGGSGLGLNIAHNMVSGILDGRISAESVPGQGTCFTLALALTAPDRRNTPPAKAGPIAAQ